MTTKKPVDFIERNIQTFIANRTRDVFGTGHVQRVCKISYNQARHTIEEMLRQKIITCKYDCGLSYVFNHKIGGDCVRLINQL